VAVQALADEREGGAVRLVSIPEDAEHRAPAVDAIFADRVGEFAAEHTRLDSYAGQSDTGAMIDGRLGPLRLSIQTVARTRSTKSAIARTTRSGSLRWT
jgi:hypothetical protein